MAASEEPTSAAVPDAQGSARATLRVHALPLLIVLALALGARVFAYLDLRGSLYFTSLMPDEGVYDAWAKAIANGGAVDYVSDFPKLPAYMFASVYRVFGDDVAHARMLDVLIGVCVVAVLYACGALIGGTRVALVTGVIAALTRALVFHSVTVHTTALSLLLAALALCGLLLVTLHPERRLLAKVDALGALLGVTVNVRPNLAVLLPVALLLLWLATGRAGIARRARLLAAGGLLAAYVTCAALCGGVFGPAYGFNLYLGNDPSNPAPYFRPAPFAASDPSRQSVSFTLEASRRAGHVLTSAQASSYFAAEVARGFAHAPVAFAGKLAKKALLVLHHDVPANNHNFAFLSGQLRSLRWPWFPDWAVLALGVLGLCFGSNRAARKVGRWAAGAYAGTLVLFFVEERLRAPLIALLAPFAGLMLVDLYERVRATRSDWQGGSTLTLALSALGLCAIAWWPMPGADGLSTAYNLHALVLYDAKRYDEAERFYKRSAELDEQDSPGAYLGLSAIYEKRDDWQGALRVLLNVPDSDYQAAAKYHAAGNLALGNKMLREAAIAYEKSLAIDGSNLRVYPPLAVASQLLGARTHAEDVKKRLRYAESFYTR